MRLLHALSRRAHSPVRPGAARERGAALVEFTMVLPLLLALIFGIVDFGRAFQSWITITNAAREGARLGTTGGSVSEICNRVQSTAAVSGATCTVTGVPGVTGDDVSVKVDYTLNLITPLGSMMNLLSGNGMSTTFNLSSTAVMRIE